MSEVFKHKFLKAVRKALHSFNVKYLIDVKHPVINLVVKQNIVDILHATAVKHNDEVLAQLLLEEEMRYPLEAALRLMVIDSDTLEHINPVLSSSLIVGKFISKEIVQEVKLAVKESTYDYKGHKCEGTVIGDRVHGLIFMRYYDSMATKSQAMKLALDISNAIRDTPELNILDNIAESHLQKFEGRSKLKFKNAYESIVTCMSFGEDSDMFYVKLWHNRSFLSTMDTGLWAGVHKLMAGGVEGIHSARDTFIQLYSNAHK